MEVGGEKARMSKIETRNLSVYYDGGAVHALKEVNIKIEANRITALIGPSGCGKTTFLRALNRMNELNGVKTEGEVIICLLYTSPSPRDLSTSRMPSSA